VLNRWSLFTKNKWKIKSKQKKKKFILYRLDIVFMKFFLLNHCAMMMNYHHHFLSLVTTSIEKFNFKLLSQSILITCWIFGKTPPCAMVTPDNNLFSSSSFRIANWRWRGIIRVFLLSRAAFPANSRISAERYSRTYAN
jgi:hypothetical protein